MKPAAKENGEGRLDRWLWAARFYKTRSLAAQAVDGGKVQVNGDRAKRSKTLHVGDEVRLRRGPFEFVVAVMTVSEHRGPAKEAALLYQESESSRLARETLATQLRYSPAPVYEGKGRPTKKDRRMIERLET
ncbi:MAG: RNA-binding S4 domain-containing protein [Gemmatimonadetes bacterium]|nr:RNA-binding S4 domain-containing protein [Gemmatimonadota bacterium]